MSKWEAFLKGMGFLFFFFVATAAVADGVVKFGSFDLLTGVGRWTTLVICIVVMGLIIWEMTR